MTLIELAENKVPLSELQPMVALRQIPKKDPPKLIEEEKWSSEFKDFLVKCLQKEPDERYSSEQLLKVKILEAKINIKIKTKIILMYSIHL